MRVKGLSGPTGTRMRSVGLARATLADGLAVDGDLPRNTDVMVAACVRVVRALNERRVLDRHRAS